jgi:hypothetical protein
VLVLLVTGFVAGARWGIWGQVTVHVTGEVSLDAGFREHSGGFSPRPCRDSVAGTESSLDRFPVLARAVIAGRPTLTFFEGDTGSGFIRNSGRFPSTRASRLVLGIDGRTYSFVRGTTTLYADGSAAGSMLGGRADQSPTASAVMVTFAWSCRDGLVPH